MLLLLLSPVFFFIKIDEYLIFIQSLGDAAENGEP